MTEAEYDRKMGELIDLAKECHSKHRGYQSFTLMFLYPDTRPFNAAMEQMRAVLDGTRTEPVTDASIGFNTGDDGEDVRY